jgi:hypothetical protein
MNLARSRALLAILVAAVATVIAATSASLPDTVGANFARGGRVISLQPRETYRTMMILFALLAPVVTYLLAGWMPRLVAGRLHIPNRELWLVPERRAATFDWIEGHAAVTAGVVAMFVLALHLITVRANRIQPPRFESWTWGTVFAAWILFVIGSAVSFQMRFRRPPAAASPAAPLEPR